MKFDISKYILPAGLLYLAWQFLRSQGLISKEIPLSSEISKECPKGQKYSRGIFGDCDPNYLSMGYFWDDICECQTKPQKPIVTTVTNPSIIDDIKNYVYGGDTQQFIPNVPSTLASPSSLSSTGGEATSPIINDYSGNIGYVNPITGLTPWQEIQISSTPSTPSISNPLPSGGTYPPGSFAGVGGIID